MLLILRRLELCAEWHATTDRIWCLITIGFLIIILWAINVLGPFLRFNLKAAVCCGIFLHGWNSSWEGVSFIVDQPISLWLCPSLLPYQQHSCSWPTVGCRVVPQENSLLLYFTHRTALPVPKLVPFLFFNSIYWYLLWVKESCLPSRYFSFLRYGFYV